MDDQIAQSLRRGGRPHPTRLLRFLLEDEHCVSQCTAHIGLTQGAVSKQLATLADAGLLTCRRASRRQARRRPPCPVSLGASGRRAESPACE
ncbi:MAG: ArsR family transcriptional regulator [Actinomycetota bacterium]|nr:ArsR family transcriptional regulator [Actinomycetota bacterium]